MRQILIFSCLFFAAAALGQNAEALFQQANQAFQNNDYQQAVELYEHLLENNFRSPDLEYNLANAYYRLNDLGNAILHYERALLLAPDDADVKHNLSLARQRLEDNIEALPEFFLAKWWKNLRRFASSSTWGIFALILWWGGLAGFCIWLLGQSRAQKKRGFFIGAACLTASLLPFSLALSRMTFEQNTRQAIVMEGTASLRSAPDEAGTEILMLHEGTKVELLDKLSNWWKVRLPNGDEGWLEGKMVEKI